MTIVCTANVVMAEQAYRYPQYQEAGDYNPWIVQPGSRLPGAGPGDDRPRDAQQQRQYNNQAAQNRMYSGGHFVTPELLESLKRQQSQYQVMHENRGHQYQSQWPGRSIVPGVGVYGGSPYGFGMANPLYDSPAISPWGSLPDMLYRGETVPVVPEAAIGGIAPLDTTVNSPLLSEGISGPVRISPGEAGGDYSSGGTGSDALRNGTGYEGKYGAKRYQNNLFNPYTFLPDANLK